MIDRFLYSEEKELLELEGATPKGIEIIDELNELSKADLLLINLWIYYYLSS